MKVIQSFWTKPFLNNKDDVELGRFNGGWPSYEINFLSWAFSCLSLQKYYGDITLYTDYEGKEIMIDYLKLPYKSYNTELDNLTTYNSDLWALGKVYTYSLQSQPFLHVDGDFYVWNKFPNSFLNSAIIAQSPENDIDFYQNIIKEVQDNFFVLPEVLDGYLNEGENIGGLNAGILGGTDINFFKKYSRQALDLIDTNANWLKGINLSHFNSFYEQYLLKCMASVEEIGVNYLLENVSQDFRELTQYHLLPEKQNFIHMVGFAKKQTLLCEQLKLRFSIQFPKEYARITTLLKV